jgi:hypothetical protein
MGLAFAIALGLATAVLATRGTGAKGLVRALQVTARWSFLPFWLAYVSGSMSALFGPTFDALARRGREFGLAYAAAQLIHVGIVVWLFQISPEPPLSGILFAYFTIGIIWTYLLAALSFGRLIEILGPRTWRTLRVVGLNYILSAFAFDFVRPILHLGTAHHDLSLLVQYLPFVAMCIAAPLLTIAAAVRRRRLGMRYHQAEPPAVERLQMPSSSKP